MRLKTIQICCVVLLFGCEVDRSGLGTGTQRTDGSRDLAVDVSRRSDGRAEADGATESRGARDAGEDAQADLTVAAGEDAVDLGVADSSPDLSGPDLLAPDTGLAESAARDLAREHSPEAGREAGRESGSEPGPDLAPPAREAGPEASKCPAECHEGCNVGCGPRGQCLSCATCSCSVESGVCHC